MSKSEIIIKQEENVVSRDFENRVRKIIGRINVNRNSNCNNEVKIEKNKELSVAEEIKDFLVDLKKSENKEEVLIKIL